ncbi:MAG: SRPBCC domain-containing protein [Chloroflexota bacterium]
MEFKASTTINAPADTIWQIITDAPGYPNWDPGVIKIEGTIASGEKITAWSKLSPDRAFPVTVSEFTPGKKMVWSSGMPMGLFKGVRTFSLTPQGDAIEFTLHEVFSGLLLPLIGRSIPDMTQTFQDFVDGLKSEAEKQG